MKNHLIVTFIYDQLCTFEFGCAVGVFGIKRPEIDIPPYRFATCALKPGKIKAAGGITIEAPYSLSLLDKADTIIIPGWPNLETKPPEALIKKIRSAYKRGARICSICLGAFVLAESGILDGKKATTHWLFAQELNNRYPKIKIDPNVLYIDEGQVMTSAGSAAGLDMFLHIIKKDHGSKIANQIAQRIVIPPHREGGQAQFIPKPILSSETDNLNKLMKWVRQQLTKQHTIEDLANRASMSVRTLHRKFNEATGLSPYEWIIRERIEKVKDYLESSKMTLSHIADLSGFGSVESLRKHFRRYVLISPIAYRQQFKIENKK
jgi:AraC family transcriptional activator FtrA